MAKKKQVPASPLDFKLNVGKLDKQRLKRLNDHMQYIQDHYNYIKPGADYKFKKDELERILLYANHEMLECIVIELLFDPCKSEVVAYMRRKLREDSHNFSKMPEDFLKKL